MEKDFAIDCKCEKCTLTNHASMYFANDGGIFVEMPQDDYMPDAHTFRFTHEDRIKIVDYFEEF